MADRSVVIRLGLNASGLAAGARTAEQSLKGIGSRGLDWVGRNQQSISELSTTVGALGLAAVGAAGATAKAAIDWESAWAGVTKTVDGTSAQMTTLEDDLRELARTMPATHEEIAGVAEAAGQLGIATGDVASFTETMIMLGETTNLTAEESATALARVGNIMDTAASDVDRMGATIVELGNNAETTEAEIVEMSTRLAAAGRQAGLSEADIFAVASTLTSVGVKAEAGGTALSKVFTSISDAVRDGSEDLGTFARVAGTTTEEFQRAFEEDAAGAIGMFVEGMGNLAREGESTSQVFDELGLTDQSLMRAILSAGSATGMWAEQVELANEAWDENTALTDEAEQRFETTAAQMQTAWNNIKDAAIEFGEAALPMIGDLSEKVGETAEWFGSLPEPVQQASLAIAGGGGLVALGVAGLGKLVVAISNTRDALANVGVEAGQVRGAIRLLGRASLWGAALAAADEFGSRIRGTKVDAEELRDEMLRIGRGGGPGEQLEKIFGENLEGVGVSIDRVNDGLRQLVDLASFDFMDMGTSDFRKQWEDLDATMAALVEGGNADAAHEVLVRLTEAAERQGKTTSEVQRLLPGFTQAWDDWAAENSTTQAHLDGTSDGMDQVGQATGETTGKIEDQSEALTDLIDKLQASGLTMLSTREAERNLEQAIDAATDALDDNGATLDITTEKGRKNQSALDDIASSTHDLISAMAEQGASEKELQGVIEDSRAQFIEMADQMGLNEEQAEALADELGLIPGDYTAIIEADDQASGEIDNVRDKARALDGLESTIYIRQLVSQSQPLSPYIAAPGNARGTDYWRGGLTWVGEEGPELVNLPRGSRVYPADESRRMTRSAMPSTSTLVPLTPSQSTSAASASGGEFSGELFLDSGEFLGMVRGQVRQGISESNRELRRRAGAGTGAAR